MNKLFFLIYFLFFSTISWAQIPSGYYNTAMGQSGTNLKNKLHQKIRAHTKRSYTQLWTDFQTTDRKSNGKVWDMYSDVPGGTPSYEHTYTSTQCGTYSTEGDCYNREHSFPKSWWGGSTSDTMYTDLFHLVPTDGKVNQERGNYPYGEVGTASWTSTNGSKVGNSNYSGYSSTVFEPIDDYKGDFARNYFYMATRYVNRIDSWSSNSDMLDGSGYSSWALNLLLDWHQQDPVSQKEIDRNDDVYGIQNNRNPFIDHPEFVHRIWGGDDDYAPIFYGNYPTSDNITSTSFDLVVNLDETCTAYYIVLADGATAPSAAHVMAGKDASGTIVAANLRGSISVAASNTEYSESISSLTSNASYDIYSVAEDNASPSNSQSGPTLLEVTLSTSGSGSSTAYSENFDDNANWTTGSGYSNGSYTLSSPSHDDSFSSNKVIKETTETHSVSNAWRLDDVAGAYLRYECKGAVSSFSIFAARWDNSPKPNITVRYSINSGSSYSTAFTLDGDDFAGDKVYKQFSHSFASAITNNTGNKIYIEFLTTSGERMLYDDFEITFGSASSSISTESDIVKKSAWNEPADIDYDNYSAINTLTISNSIEIAQFSIQDGGSDNTDSDTETTKLTDIDLTIDNWENIAALAIFEGSNNKSEVTSINSSTISFNSISGGIEAADEGMMDFSVYATFKSTVTDNDNLKITISSATADNSGSDFAASDAGAATTDNSGNKNKIVVSANHLAFNSNKPPNTVNTNADFEVEVEALDANDNRDLDANQSLSLSLASGNGAFSSASNLSQTMNNGYASWTDVQYNTAETFSISATVSGLTSATSSNISASSSGSYFSDLLITEYVEGSSNNKYLEIWNNTGATVDLSDYRIDIYANGSNTASTSISLSGSLYDQDEYIIANSSATVWSGTPELSTGSLSFNGNDAVVLVNTNAKGDVDVIGTVGSSSDFAKDKTIRRNGNVSGPSTTYNSSDWTDYSVDDVSGLDNSGPLPISLVSFSVKLNCGFILISWQTATEENNDHFTLERSYNAQDFIPIAEIVGAGNSNNIQDYSYIDNTANLQITIYYKLKQTDFDGNYSYSEIISVNSITSSLGLLKTFFVDGNLHLQINSSLNADIRFEIYDVSGRMLSNDNINLIQGMHNYKQRINQLSNGIYFIRLIDKSNGSIIQDKFIVM